MNTLTLQLTDDGFAAVKKLQAHFQLSEPQEVFVYALGMLDMAVEKKDSQRSNVDSNKKRKRK